jgi:coenzyme F420 hydrogenase subunit beta
LQALRRIASSPHGAKKLAERVKIAVSLFCFNTYKYKPLFTDYLKNQQGLDLSKITKIDCKSGRFKFYEGTNIAHEATVKDLQTFIHPGCGKCQDFSGELSDISVGNTGSEPGWCTVITRTSDSDKLFKEMADSGVIELKPAPSMIDAITKLSEAKRKRPAPYIRS